MRAEHHQLGDLTIFFPIEFYCCVNLTQSLDHIRHCAINIISATELQLLINVCYILRSEIKVNSFNYVHH